MLIDQQVLPLLRTQVIYGPKDTKFDFLDSGDLQ